MRILLNTLAVLAILYFGWQAYSEYRHHQQERQMLSDLQVMQNDLDRLANCMAEYQQQHAGQLPNTPQRFCEVLAKANADTTRFDTPIYFSGEKITMVARYSRRWQANNRHELVINLTMGWLPNGLRSDEPATMVATYAVGDKHCERIFQAASQ